MRPRAAFKGAQSSVSRTPEMKLIRWLVLIVATVVLIYGASPYFSFWRFTVAVRSRDARGISARVDFPAVRASLKRQLVARFAKATSTHKRWSNLGPTLIDAMIDAYVTPDGIAAIALKSGSAEEPEGAAPISISRSAITQTRRK